MPPAGAVEGSGRGWLLLPCWTGLRFGTILQVRFGKRCAGPSCFTAKRGEHQKEKALRRGEGSLGLFGCSNCWPCLFVSITSSSFTPLHLPFYSPLPPSISFLWAFPHLNSPLTPMPANYCASLCDYLLHAEGESRQRGGEEVRERASVHEKWLQSVPHCSETFGKGNEQSKLQGCARVCEGVCVCVAVLERGQ